MAKILVEFYSGRTPENLISVLKERCDHVHFFSFSQRFSPSREEKAALTALVKELIGSAPSFSQTKELSLDAALRDLEKLLDEKNEYMIDITGGDEIFIAAAGILIEKKKAKVYLHQYDVQHGKRVFRYPPKKEEAPFFPHYLSAPQLLTLNGTPPLSAPMLNFSTGNVKGEVLRLWNAVKSCPKEWNRFCSLAAEEGGSTLKQKIIQSGAISHAYQRVSDRLENAGILLHETRERQGSRSLMEFELDVPPEAEFLYKKGGNLLEAYCALCAHESGVFHDIRIGVCVDWDGKSTGTHRPDPRNEIDLVLMHENLPILSSCKNTAPKNKYLYEISTMAKHYGGYFATAAMFSSGRATPTVKKRAEEMGIVLIDGIRYLSPQQFSQLLKTHFSK